MLYFTVLVLVLALRYQHLITFGFDLNLGFGPSQVKTSLRYYNKIIT
jgi:hypothetical protein